MKQAIYAGAISIATFFGYIVIHDSQPKPLVINETTWIQPITENDDWAKQYRYTQMIKVYYTDPLSKPLILTNGDSLTSYCSDETKVTFVTQAGDTISKYGNKWMSCKIMVGINYTKQEIDRLRKPMKEMIIYNYVTDNTFKFKIENVHYFEETLIPWTR